MRDLLNLRVAHPRTVRRAETRPTNRLTQLRTRLSHGLLGFDAWLNDGLYNGGRSFGEAYGRYAEKIQRRFRVTGAKRFVLDLASEG